MSIYLDELLASKKVVLLQGPIGSFFTDLSDWLTTQHIESFKVNFNAGDWRYYHSRPNIWHYREKAIQFGAWLSKKIQENQIDAIVCFGDCRFYHQQAYTVAQQLNIKFYVFEEGYIRPDYLTFEEGGVNYFSNFKQLFLEAKDNEVKELHRESSDNNYHLMLWSGFQYYLCWALFFWLYPFYKHHRGYNPIEEFGYWFMAMLRRFRNSLVEPKRFDSFIQQHNKNYFIYTLQVHNDSQVRVHSDYQDIRDCIAEVITSFAQHSEAHHHLVLKHHPMDRGYRHYGQLIQDLSKQLGIQNRIHYFCDIHLPTLLKHGLGLVTINSTTGIQALYHHIPVKTLGHALYDLPGLTAQTDLDQFWKNPKPPDEAYFHFFREKLIELTQLNGAYYGKNFWMK
ncbi:hypothetical protein F971_03299 [Acinetobacter vivianii]|uniref:Capsule polysaccharide biosynthesis protein n=1 Tax=Acinetobacter vivianii TaxID=1776742 RepID=N8UU97_9GAMM|nr:capsular biosynthesis protein [Acinetobacter vivianii]ENU91161.1 hypothetical protein F971_03299 [Acinetobacter vivianii]